MTPETLNPEPSPRAVAAAQLRMLTLLQKRDFLVLGLFAVVLVGLLIWGQMQMDANMDTDASDAVAIFRGLALPLALVGTFWPLGVWRAAAPEHRGYFWSLPVDRRRHTVLRVGMGWVVLMAVCLISLAVGVLTFVPSAIRFEGAQIDFTGVWEPLVTATLAYVLMSVLSIFFDSPMRAFVLAWLMVLGLYVVGNAAEDLDWLVDAVEGGVSSLFVAVGGPIIADEGGTEWVRHYLIWLALGAAAMIGAVLWRHEEK
jgi:hypothetical protein